MGDTGKTDVRIKIEDNTFDILDNLKDPEKMRLRVGEYVAAASDQIRRWGGFDRFYEMLARKADAEKRPQLAANFVRRYHDNERDIKNEARALAYTLNDIYSLGNKDDVDRFYEHKENGRKICGRTYDEKDLVRRAFEREKFKYVIKYAEKKLSKWEDFKAGKASDLVFTNNETIKSVKELKEAATNCDKIKQAMVPAEIFDYLYGKYFIFNANDKQFVKLGEHIRGQLSEMSKHGGKMQILYEPVGAEGAIPYGSKNASVHAQVTKGVLISPKLITSIGQIPSEFDEQVYQLAIYYNEVGL